MVTENKLFKRKTAMDETEGLVDYKIVKANSFIEKGRDTFSLTQQKAILLALSKINPSTDNKDYIGIKEVSIREILGKNTKDKIAGSEYLQVKDSLEDLPNHGIQMKSNTANKWKSTGFISSAEKLEGSDVIEIKFDSSAYQYLIGLKQYTEYLLSHVYQFENRYSLKIYEICKQYLSFGKREIEYSYLRELLTIEKYTTYDSFANFRNKILNKVIKDINEYSDMEISFEEKKKHRKVEAVIFHFKQKKINPVIQNKEDTKGQLGIFKKEKIQPVEIIKENDSSNQKLNNNEVLLECPSWLEETFYNGLIKKFDKELVDFSISEIEKRDNIDDNKNFLFKSLKENYFVEKLELHKKIKQNEKEKKDKSNKLDQLKQFQEKIKIELNTRREKVMNDWLDGKYESVDLIVAEFTYQCEKSENSIDRKSANRLMTDKGNATDLRIATKWYILNAEDDQITEEDKYIIQLFPDNKGLTAYAKMYYSHKWIDFS